MNRPNIVLFQADDVGYGDLNINGHPTTRTPNIDALYLDQGIKFTQMITPDSVCTPNRAAILTSKYPIRLGFSHNWYRVVYDSGMPSHLPWNTSTIGTTLQRLGYHTAIFGKWHLGLNVESNDDGLALPTNFGFDYYFGVPFGSNPYNDPNGVDSPYASTLYENTTLIQQPVDMYAYTGLMNDRIEDWVIGHKNQPFFLFVNYLQTHTPLFASEEFQNQTRRGKYGDDLMEMDYSIGKIRSLFEQLNIDQNTIWMFVSDNGPYAEEKVDGGSAGLFKGNKGQTWEGGHRQPFIVRYPALAGKVTRMINYNPVSTLDIYPTIVHYAGGYIDEEVDGVVIDIQAAYNDQTIARPRVFYYYCGERVLAVRYGNYKVHFYTQKWKDVATQSCAFVEGLEYGVCDCTDRTVEIADPPLMYDVEHDPSEKYTFDQSHPDYNQTIAIIDELLRQHTQSIVPVDNQLEKKSDPALYPCCDDHIGDPTVCCCGHPSCVTMF